MNDVAPLVLDLLNYIEQVEKLKAKPAFSVPTEYFSALQEDLKGLPEVQFNGTGGVSAYLRCDALSLRVEINNR